MIGKIWRRNCHHVTMHMQIQWWKFSSGCMYTKISHNEQTNANPKFQYNTIFIRNSRKTHFGCLLQQTKHCSVLLCFNSFKHNCLFVDFSCKFRNFRSFRPVYYIRAIFKQFSHICEWNYFAKKKQFANSEANNCLAVYGSQICKYYILHMHYAVLVLNVFVMTKLSFLRKFALKFNMHQQISAVFSQWN